MIAPDCFGDSLTAVQAAQAIATGWARARPGDVLVPAPQSDGGPGFGEVLAGRIPGAQQRHSRVCGPLSTDVDAVWIFDPDPPTAYLECAQACGLALLGGPPTPQTALDAHSRGVGQLIDAALRAGAREVIVGLGGSACTDGGAGMIDTLGGLPTARARLAGVGLVVATDVEHPLLGCGGAAHVFGPQKGADPATVDLLEQRLTAWASTLEEAGRPVRDLPGAGAAGGLGAALLAVGARRESGADVIAAATGLAGDIAAADLIVTGEGRLDESSLRGKVVGSLARAALRRGVPLVVLAGQVSLSGARLRAAGIVAHSLSDYAGSVSRAVEDAGRQLSGLAQRTAVEWTADRLTGGVTG